jgi:peptide/nickel transport system substrate-binding protein
MPDHHDSRGDHAHNARGMTRSEVLRGAVGAGLFLTTPGLAAACSSSSSSSSPTTGGGAPKAGGTLRLGFTGNGNNETMDPGLIVADVDGARVRSLFDPLVESQPNLDLKPGLAESWEPNSTATVWTVRLRSGVEWHDGKPLTADDVIYTLKRNAQNSKLDGHSTVAPIDLAGVKKMDNLTVQIPLHYPVANLFASFYQHFMSVVQDGATNFDKPIGTGPFKFKSWTPGTSSVFVKNPNYWQSGRPYVNELECQSIPDPGARFNALTSGEIDGMNTLSFSQAKTQAPASNITVLTGDGPVDVRVRQAMRLIADRSALVSTAQLGYGQIGNDLFGKGIQFYDTSLQQREPDIDQAKHLLKAAGADGLQVTLYSSNFQPGLLESALAFSQQAKAAGVTVNVNNGPGSTYFSDHYLKAPFMQSVWNPTPLSTWMISAVTSDAPFNETHWKDPAFDKLVKEASAQLDTSKAADLWNQAQQILWNEGGYLIWGFQPWLDGLASNVHGATGSYAGSLGYWNFRDWWLS